MYIHTVKNPNLNHHLKNGPLPWRVRNTAKLFLLAMRAVFDPNVVKFEIDKQDNRKIAS